MVTPDNSPTPLSEAVARLTEYRAGADMIGGMERCKYYLHPFAPCLGTDIDILLDAVAEGREDRDRLDWIDTAGASVVPAWSGYGARIGVVAQDSSLAGRTERRATVREAIDAARERVS